MPVISSKQPATGIRARFRSLRCYRSSYEIPLTVLALPLARKLIVFQTQAVRFHEALPVRNALEVGCPAFLIGWRRIGPFWAPLEGIIEAGGVIWRDVLLFVRPRTARQTVGGLRLSSSMRAATLSQSIAMPLLLPDL